MGTKPLTQWVCPRTRADTGRTSHSRGRLATAKQNRRRNGRVRGHARTRGSERGALVLRGQGDPVAAAGVPASASCRWRAPLTGPPSRTYTQPSFSSMTTWPCPSPPTRPDRTSPLDLPSGRPLVWGLPHAAATMFARPAVHRPPRAAFSLTHAASSPSRPAGPSGRWRRTGDGGTPGR